MKLKIKQVLSIICFAALYQTAFSSNSPEDPFAGINDTKSFITEAQKLSNRMCRKSFRVMSSIQQQKVPLVASQVMTYVEMKEIYTAHFKLLDKLQKSVIDSSIVSTDKQLIFQVINTDRRDINYCLEECRKAADGAVRRYYESLKLKQPHQPNKSTNQSQYY
jgi:hypothetical protein